jgi:hypothetical protein
LAVVLVLAVGVAGRFATFASPPFEEATVAGPFFVTVALADPAPLEAGFADRDGVMDADPPFVDPPPFGEPARDRAAGRFARPIGSLSPTALTAPLARSPTSPAILPAVRPTCLTTLPGSGMS